MTRSQMRRFAAFLKVTKHIYISLVVQKQVLRKYLVKGKILYFNVAYETLEGLLHIEDSSLPSTTLSPVLLNQVDNS